LKILLIGGTGFIGSRLLSALMAANHQVNVASRNPGPYQIKITPGEALGIGFNEFDIVVNAAGKYGVKESKEEINLTFEANIGVCTSISKSLHSITKGVINLSSYFEILPKESPTRNMYYAKSKVIGNEILQNACAICNKKYSRIVLFDNYDKDLSRGKVLDKLIQSVLASQSLTVKNVQNFINLLSTDQVTEAVVQVVESFKTSQPLIGRIDIKNQKSYKILDLIQLVESFSGRRLHFENLDQNLDFELQKVVLEKKETHINFNLSDEVPSYLKKMLKFSA
jgi:nucleoside-diphosphate-sugar epimerase